MLGLSLSLWSAAVNGAVAPSYEPEATALFARMSVQPDATRKGLINNLIKSLKTAGVWSKLVGLHVIAAHDAQAARLNWKSSSYNLTAFGSPVFTVDRGYTGDTSAAYLGTGFTPSTAGSILTQDSAHYGGWALNSLAAATTNRLVGQVTTTNPRALLLPRSTSDLLNYIVNAGTGTTVADATTAGHYIANRSASAAIQAYKNGSSISTATTTSGGLPAFEITYLRDGSNYSGIQSAVGHFGSSLTAQNVADLYSALQTYLQAVGAVA